MLTPEQIEIQRRNFEVSILKEYPFATFDRYSSGEYRNSSIQSAFDGWLSCVESNEIELPKAWEALGANGLYYDVIDINDAVKSIEAQGFMVKV